MKLSTLLVSGLLALSGVAGCCRVPLATEEDAKEPTCWDKTQETAFKQYPGGDWWWFDSTKTSDFYVNIKRLDINKPIVKAWVRVFNYDDQQVVMSIWYVNRKTAQIGFTDDVVYNMGTGLVVPGHRSTKRVSYDNIIPDSIADTLMGFYNSRYQKDKKRTR